MSTTIDNRIVEMQFNNQQFERNIGKSMKSLGSFEKYLNSMGRNSSGALSSLSNAFNALSLDRIANGIDAIGNRIYSVTSFAGRMVENLEHTAINAAKRIANAVLVQPMSTGMGKYDAMMNAKQTMRAVLGEGQMGEVNKALETLQEYSDQTSYSFSTMTDALSKFISAGQKDLPKSAKAITGIANAAAKAGVGITQATPAFQALAKAMTAGKMTLQQYQSLELMNFAGEDFNKQLIEAGVKVGTLIRDEKTGKTTVKGQKNKEVNLKTLRDMLRYGWATAEVLEEVLTHFADDEEAYAAAQNAKNFADVWSAVLDSISTGWMDTYKLIFGDLQEAIDLFTGMADAIMTYFGNITAWRNGVLTDWRGNGLEKSEAQDIKTAKEYAQIVEDYAKANEKYIKSVEDVEENGKKYRRYTFAFDTDENGKKLKKGKKREVVHVYEVVDDPRSIKELQTFIDSIVDGREEMVAAVSSLWEAFTWISDSFGAGFGFVATGLGHALLDASIRFHEFADNVTAFVKQPEISAFFGGLGVGLASILDILGQIGGAGIHGFLELSKILSPLAKSVGRLVGNLGSWVYKQKNLLKQNKTFEKTADKLVEAFKPVSDLVAPLSESIMNFANEFLNGGEGFEKFETIFKGVGDAAALVTDAFSHLIYIGSKLFSTFAVPALQRIGGALLDIFTNVASWITTVREHLEASDAFNKFRQEIDKLIQTYREKLEPVLTSLADLFKPVIDGLSEFFATTGEGILAAIDTDTSEETTLRGKMIKRLEAFLAVFDNGEVLATAQQFYADVQTTLKPITEALEPIQKLLADFWTGIGNFFTYDEEAEKIKWIKENARTIHSEGGDVDKAFKEKFGTGSFIDKLRLRIEAFGNAFEDNALVKTVEATKEKISKLLQPVREALSSIGSLIGGLLGGIGASFGGNGSSGISEMTGEMTSTEAEVTGFGEAIGKFLGGIISGFLKALENISFGDAAKLGLLVMEIQALIGQKWFNDLIGGLADVVWDVHQGLRGGNFIQARLVPLAASIMMLGTGIKQIADAIHVLSDVEVVDTGDGSGLVAGVGSIIVVLAALAGFLGFTKAGGSKSITNKLSGGLFEGGTYSKEIEKFSKNIGFGTGTALMELCVGLKSIAESIKMLSEIKVVDSGDGSGLVAGVGSIVVVLASLAAFLGFTKAGGSKKTVTNDAEGLLKGKFAAEFEKFAGNIGINTGTAILELAFSLKVISEAISELSKVPVVGDDGEGLVAGVASVVTILGALAGFLMLNKGGGSKKISIKELQAGKGGFQQTLTNLLDQDGAFSPATGWALIQLSNALKTISEAVKTLATLPVGSFNEEGIVTGVGSLIAILVALGVFLKTTDLGDVASQDKWYKALSSIHGTATGEDLKDLANSLKTIADAVAQLANLPVFEVPDDASGILEGKGLLGGVGSILFILTALGIFLNKTQLGDGSDQNKWYKALSGLTGTATGEDLKDLATSLQMISQAVMSLSNLPVFSVPSDPADANSWFNGSGLLSGVGSILLILTALGLFLNGTKTQTSDGLGPSFLAAFEGAFGTATGEQLKDLATSLQGIANAVDILAKIDIADKEKGNGIISGVGALGAILAELGGFLTAQDKFFGGPGLAGSIDKLAVGAEVKLLGESMLNLATAFDMLSKLQVFHNYETKDVEGNIVSGVTGMGAILTELGIFMKYVMNESNPIQAGTQVLQSFSLELLAKALVDIANSFNILSTITPEQQALSAITEGGFLFALLKMLELAGNVNPITALKAILVMEEVVIALGGTLAAIGAIAQNTDLMQWLDKGGEAMEKIGAGFGKLIGGFIGGVAGGAVNEVADSSDGLSQIGDNFKSLSDKLKDVDLDQVSTAVGILTLITDAASVGMSATWDGVGPMVGFGTALENVASGISEIAKVFDENDTSIERGTSFLEPLARLTALFSKDTFTAGDKLGSEGAGFLDLLMQSIQNETGSPEFLAYADQIRASIEQAITPGTNGVYSPTIRPVLDMSGIGGSYSDVNGSLTTLFDVTGMNSQISSVVDAINTANTQVKAKLDITNMYLANINNTTDSFRQANHIDLGTLNNTTADLAGHLQVLVQLDGQTIAATIAPLVDSYLGHELGS